MAKDQPAEPPPVPTFFSPDDLPDWLRGAPAAAPPAPPPMPTERTRAAWVTRDRSAAPETGDPFRTAAGETWRLIAPAPTRRQRARAIRWRGRVATLGVALSLLVGWLVGRG